jgi:guanylate kinase
MLVLSSPSGAGKTTISRRLLEIDSNLTMSISATTRPRRPAESDGRDYIFVSDDEFDQMSARDEFLEHAEVFGYRYGTPRGVVEGALEAGEDVLFDVDWQGTQQLAERAGEDLVSIFILPPTREELERRLRTRAQDSDEVVHERMAKAANEMSHWREYDYLLINEEFEVSVDRVRSILTAERLRRDRLTGTGDFVRELSEEV